MVPNRECRGILRPGSEKTRHAFEGVRAWLWLNEKIKGFLAFLDRLMMLCRSEDHCCHLARPRDATVTVADRSQPGRDVRKGLDDWRSAMRDRGGQHGENILERRLFPERLTGEASPWRPVSRGTRSSMGCAIRTSRTHRQEHRHRASLPLSCGNSPCKVQNLKLTRLTPSHRDRGMTRPIGHAESANIPKKSRNRQRDEDCHPTQQM